MAVSFVGLFVLAGLAGVVFLAVLGLVALMTNPRTRDVARILLGGTAALAVMLVVVAGFLFTLRVERQENVRREARLEQLGQQFRYKETLPDPAESATLAAPAAVPDPLAPPEKPADPVHHESDLVDGEAAKAGTEAAEAEAVVLEKPEPSDSPEAEPSKGEVGEAAGSETKPDPETAPDEEAVAPKKPDPPSSDQAEASEQPADVAANDTKAVADGAMDKTAVAPKKPDGADSAKLSVPPLVDDGRPPWVDRKPYKEGSVYYWPVATDPCPDSTDAEEVALPKALHVAVADYVKGRLQLGSGAAGRVRLAPDYLRNNMVGDDVWIEPLSLSVGEFVRVHALVKFDRQANQIIHEQWHQHQLKERLWLAAGLLCVVICVLALVYCYLKVDLITGGSRRGLLRIAAILVILGLILVAAGVVAAGVT